MFKPKLIERADFLIEVSQRELRRIQVVASLSGKESCKVLNEED